MKLKPYIAVAPLAICSLLACIFGIKTQGGVFYLLLALIVIEIIGAVMWLIVRERKLQKEIDSIFNENSAVSRQIINNINIPCLFCTANGQIAWRNDAFNAIYDGKNIKKLLTAEELSSVHSFEKTVGEHSYSVNIMPVVRANNRASSMVFQYWDDKTETLFYKNLYNDNYPVVALIYVDNYEDLNTEKDVSRSAAINEVERMISDLVQAAGGIYRRFEGARFMLLFEAKNLASIEEKRFEILNSVHNIKTGTEQNITLSIGVGHEESIELAHEAAQNAMELALGRGGDQAVVKHGSQYKFYGGKTISTTKISRVRVRSVANALREMMEISSEIFVMGHRRADMDCVGSALGLLRCANGIGCKAYYIIEGGAETVEAMMESKLPKAIADCILSPSSALEIIKKTSLLIIVDTQRESLLCSSDIFKATGNLVVIDHHRRSADAICGATISYLEPGASSASEIVTEILQCFFETKNSMPTEATAMLSGICLDTKYFVFNTGVRTFDAAGYLRRCGADTGLVKRMFQDDMSTFSLRARVVEKATVLPGGMAISVCEAESDTQIIAAQAADTLITIKGIGAAFVLTQTGSTVLISARSLGTINVQRVCEKLGGGGHLAVAGAQLKDVSIDEAIVKLKECISEYMKEEHTA